MLTVIRARDMHNYGGRRRGQHVDEGTNGRLLSTCTGRIGRTPPGGGRQLGWHVAAAAVAASLRAPETRAEEQQTTTQYTALLARVSHHGERPSGGPLGSAGRKILSIIHVHSWCSCMDPAVARVQLASWLLAAGSRLHDDASGNSPSGQSAVAAAAPDRGGVLSAVIPSHMGAARLPEASPARRHGVLPLRRPGVAPNRVVQYVLAGGAATPSYHTPNPATCPVWSSSPSKHPLNANQGRHRQWRALVASINGPHRLAMPPHHPPAAGSG
jgi:hypothetical protein